MHFWPKKSQKIVFGTLTGLVDRKHSSNMQNYEYAMNKFWENRRKHFFANFFLIFIKNVQNESKSLCSEL